MHACESDTVLRKKHPLPLCFRLTWIRLSSLLYFRHCFFLLLLKTEMAPRTPFPLISVDVRKGPLEQEKPLHNRWHPDIPPVDEVREDDLFRVETVDWTGGQIKDDDCADDVKNVDLTRVGARMRKQSILRGTLLI